MESLTLSLENISIKDCPTPPNTSIEKKWNPVLTGQIRKEFNIQTKKKLLKLKLEYKIQIQTHFSKLPPEIRLLIWKFTGYSTRAKWTLNIQ